MYILILKKPIYDLEEYDALTEMNYDGRTLVDGRG
jgi:hypothetical protein